MDNRHGPHFDRYGPNFEMTGDGAGGAQDAPGCLAVEVFPRLNSDPFLLVLY